MSKAFRWIGPGVLKEGTDTPILHKPGTLLEKHGLSDDRVQHFVDLGVAEYYKLKNGMAVSLDADGKPLPDVTPVDQLSDEDLARAQEIHEGAAEEAAALAALAAPKPEATK